MEKIIQKIKEILNKIWKNNKVSILSIFGFILGCIISSDPFSWSKFGIIFFVWFYGVNLEYLGYKRGKEENKNIE